MYIAVWKGTLKSNKNADTKTEGISFVRGEEIDPALGITLEEAAGGRRNLPPRFDGKKFMNQTKLCPTESAISGDFRNAFET